MSRWRGTVLILLLLAVSSASVGCFGITSNPSYFPSFLPAGDVIRTHAKPAGRGYYRDFDPQAARLEVTPVDTANHGGNQHVLMATVYDKDGQARRARRVEWMIEGPGHIVEVDESGIFAGRGHKIDSKYAVSYTDYFEQTITRGNSDASDDFCVKPGQTWCVVSSAVPGETVVSAYAPGVFNWDKGRVTVRLDGTTAGGTGGLSLGNTGSTLGEASTVSARVNSLATLNNNIQKVALREGVRPSDLRVRYRLSGGDPADFVAPPNVSGTRAGIDYLEVPADSDGFAPVRVKQLTPRAGRTNIAVEVYKPDGEGGTAKTLSRSSATVEWMAPALGLDIVAPKTIAANKQSEITVNLANNSKVDGSRTTVELRFQNGFNVGTATPAPDDRPQQLIMKWLLPPLAAGQRKEIRIPFVLRDNGSYVAQAKAFSEDGLEAEARSETTVGEATLKLTLEPKRMATVGESIPVKIQVQNTGTIALDEATANVSFGSGLEHESKDDPVRVTIGHLDPNEMRSVTVPLTARRSGLQAVQVSVNAGGVIDRGETSFDVRSPDLRLTMDGPKTLTPGEKAVYELGLSNQGDAAVPNATVKLTLPAGLTADQANESGSLAGSNTVLWRVGDLAAGASKRMKVQVVAERTLPKGLLQATATSGDTGTFVKNKMLDGLSTKAELNVSIAGTPALLLELAEPSEAVPIGRRAGYRIVVRNRGNGPATDVKVMALVPDEYANIRAFTGNREDVKPEGSKIFYPTIRDIPAGGAIALTFDVEGAKIGDARVRVEVTSDQLKKPISEEQSTRVVERNR